jgi:hypothetical protein
MTRTATFRVAVPLALLMSLPPAAMARPEAGALEATATGGQAGSAETTVTVQTSNAPPDAQVVLPVFLAAPEAVKVGRIELRVGFPKEVLTFVKVEPSGLAVGVDAEVKAEVKDAPSPGFGVVHASVSTVGPNGSRQSIPGGPIVYLVFTIDKTAKAGTTIALSHEATASTTDDPPKPVTPLTASKAQVIVSEPPAPACFFYMH